MKKKKDSQPTMFSILTRKNIIKPFVEGLIVNFSSYFALLIEVVTRHKYGERYMNFASCLSAAGVTLFFGVVWTDWQMPLEFLLGRRLGKNFFGVDLGAIMLLVYCLGFLVMAWRHRKEWKREGKTIDFERFSLSHGFARPECYKVAERLPKWLTKRLPVNEINLWRYYEPFSAVAVGIVFLAIPWTQTFGAVMLLCGLFYYLRTRIQISWGKEILLDKIDEIIMAEEAERIFMEDRPPEETKGLRALTPLPKDVDLRRALYEDVKNDLEGVEGPASAAVAAPKPVITVKNGQGMPKNESDGIPE